MGPYKITEDFGNNSFRIDLPDNLKSRGVHDVFHSSLLRVHIPNDDRKFPGRRDNQIPELGGTGREWAADKIICHRGSHSDAEFKVQWTAGDQSWLPYEEIAHLKALTDYFEAIGVDGIENLRDVGDGGLSDDDPQVSFGHLAPHRTSRPHRPNPRNHPSPNHPRTRASRPRQPKPRPTSPRTPRRSQRSVPPARPRRRREHSDLHSPRHTCRGSTRRPPVKTPRNTSHHHRSRRATPQSAPCLSTADSDLLRRTISDVVQEHVRTQT